MKKVVYLILFSMFLWAETSAAENADQAQSLAEEYYTTCEAQAPVVETSAVIQGNIEDVKRERKIRKCLKAKISDVASSYLSDKALTEYQTAIDDFEKSLFSIYRVLIFCKNKTDVLWCEERYKDDMSLEKLSLEKNLTSHMLKFLKQTIKSKQSD